LCYTNTPVRNKQTLKGGGFYKRDLIRAGLYVKKYVALNPKTIHTLPPDYLIKQTHPQCYLIQKLWRKRDEEGQGEVVILPVLLESYLRGGKAVVLVTQAESTQFLNGVGWLFSCIVSHLVVGIAKKKHAKTFDWTKPSQKSLSHCK
jgi:hypothetical protein